MEYRHWAGQMSRFQLRGPAPGYKRATLPRLVGVRVGMLQLWYMLLVAVYSYLLWCSAEQLLGLM